MSNEDKQTKGLKSTIARIDGRLHRVRSFQDASGKVIQQVLSPLMVEFRFQDICEIVVGACVLAIPVAFTEEAWRLGEELPWPNVIAIAFISLITISLFVYVTYYRDHLRGYVPQFLMRVFACYIITLFVVATILIVFQKFPWQTDPATAIRRLILIGFPACFSATVVDSLK